MRCALSVFSFLVPSLCCVGANSILAQSPKDVRSAAREGQGAIPAVANFLTSSSVDTRVEAVKQLTILGGKNSLDPLIRATRDADPEVQIRATDGLINYYIPTYVKQGIGSSLVRAGENVRAKFSDRNDLVIDPYISVRPDVIAAIGKLARGGASMDSRANACRALGILRGDAALPDLIEALRSKDNQVMYESLAAMQKIGDPAAGPRITYLLRDFDERVQVTAIQTSGVLRNTEALPALRIIAEDARGMKSLRAATEAIAMMPEAKDRELFQLKLTSRDDKVRASAAEGLARIGNPADEPALAKLWKDEDKMSPRLAAAFAAVMEGKLELKDDSPLQYLIFTLNSSAYHDDAYAYLVEAARKKPVLDALQKALLRDPSKEEKIYLSRVLMLSGDQSSIAVLDKMSRDDDSEVAQEGLRALRSIRARLKA